MLSIANSSQAIRSTLTDHASQAQEVPIWKPLMQEYLCLLVRSPNALVRRIVAEDPLTPMEVLQALAQDPDWTVHCCIANHPQAPWAILPILAQDLEKAVGSRHFTLPFSPP
jgi:hypothetical protein